MQNLRRGTTCGVRFRGVVWPAKIVNRQDDIPEAVWKKGKKIHACLVRYYGDHTYQWILRRRVKTQLIPLEEFKLSELTSGRMTKRRLEAIKEFEDDVRVTPSLPPPPPPPPAAPLTGKKRRRDRSSNPDDSIGPVRKRRRSSSRSSTRRQERRRSRRLKSNSSKSKSKAPLVRSTASKPQPKPKPGPPAKPKRRKKRKRKNRHHHSSTSTSNSRREVTPRASSPISVGLTPTPSAPQTPPRPRPRAQFCRLESLRNSVRLARRKRIRKTVGRILSEGTIEGGSICDSDSDPNSLANRTRNRSRMRRRGGGHSDTFLDDGDVEMYKHRLRWAVQKGNFAMIESWISDVDRNWRFVSPIQLMRSGIGVVANEERVRIDGSTREGFVLRQKLKKLLWKWQTTCYGQLLRSQANMSGHPTTLTASQRVGVGSGVQGGTGGMGSSSPFSVPISPVSELPMMGLNFPTQGQGQL